MTDPRCLRGGTTRLCSFFGCAAWQRNIIIPLKT